jgi:hypothetical protein
MRLIVSGFNHPDFNREIIAELEPLRASDAVRDRRHGRAPSRNRRRQGAEVTK